MRTQFLSAGLVLALASTASAQTAPNGEALYKTNCANCHSQTQAGQQAPGADALRQLSPEAIVTAMTYGRMQVQAIAVSDDER